MIYAIDSEDSPVTRMLDLIHRKGPLMMLAGGGHLMKERPYTKPVHFMTPEKEQRALELGRTGKLYVTQIAREVGAPQSAIFRLMVKHGIRLPDGRK